MLVCSVIAFVIRPLEHAAAGIPVDRHHLGDRFHPAHQRQQDRAESRCAQAAGREGRGGEAAEDNPAKKIVDKPEIVAAADQPQPPKPEPEKKKPDPKPPTPQPQPQKSEPKQAFAKEPEPKIDPIAEAMKKEAKKPDPKTQKKADTPVPQKKAEPQKPQPKFDRTKIAALLDKRDPQRRAITGSTLNNTPSLGTATGAAATLSQNELDALRARLRDCWNVPVGLAEARDLVVTVRIQFKQDGSLLTEPRRDEQRQPSGVPGCIRKRDARGAHLRRPTAFLPVVEIRGLEGCHRRFRSA